MEDMQAAYKLNKTWRRENKEMTQRDSPGCNLIMNWKRRKIIWTLYKNKKEENDSCRLERGKDMEESQVFNISG